MDLRAQRATSSDAGRFRHRPLRNLVLWPAAARRQQNTVIRCRGNRLRYAEQDPQQAPLPVVSGTCALLATAALLCPAAAEAVGFQDLIATLQDHQVTVTASSQLHQQQQQQQHESRLTQAPSLTSATEPGLQSAQYNPAAQQYERSAQQYSPAAQQLGPLAQQYSPAVQQLGPLAQQYSPAAQQLGPLAHQYSPAAQQHNLVAELAKVGQVRGPHWLLHVLFIVGLNVLGLWGVLKLIGWAKDSNTPVTVIKLHMGLLVDNSKLQKRLHFLQQMMSVEHGMFVTMEETIQACCRPPRGAKLTYADVQVSQLGSKHEGYDLFKQYAVVEQRAAQMEEASHVVHGEKPEAPHHRSPLERLMGVAETQDAEESQSCVVVTIVILARGDISVTEGALRDKATFRSSMQHLVGHLSTGQLLAVELLVTPNNEKDFLSEAMLMEDYPFMIDLKTGKPISTLARATSAQQGGGEAAAGYAA